MYTPVFYNKVVWITGASSGIGEELVYALNSAGAKLIISARNVAALQRVKAACINPDRVKLLLLDLTQPAMINTKVAEALNCWGPVDYMIHNAGVAARELVANTSEQVDREIMETNYFGPVALTKALLPSMMQAGHGHFVVVGSLSGKYGVPKLSAYAASKHALHGFFESLRAELHQSRIHVSFIIPGFIQTPIILNSISANGQRRMTDLEVNKTGMPADRCARAILTAIATNKAEAYIGGSEIFTLYLNRFFPNIMRWLIRQHPMRHLKNWKLVTMRILNVLSGKHKPQQTANV